MIRYLIIPWHLRFPKCKIWDKDLYARFHRPYYRMTRLEVRVWGGVLNLRILPTTFFCFLETGSSSPGDRWSPCLHPGLYQPHNSSTDRTVSFVFSVYPLLWRGEMILTQYRIPQTPVTEGTPSPGTLSPVIKVRNQVTSLSSRPLRRDQGFHKCFLFTPLQVYR